MRNNRKKSQKIAVIGISLFLLCGCAAMAPNMEKLTQSAERIKEKVQMECLRLGELLLWAANEDNHIEDERIEEVKELPDICKECRGTSQTVTSEVDYQFSLLPEKIQNLFLQDRWKISVVDYDLNRAYFDGKYEEVLGVTQYEEQTIFIADKEEAAQRAVLHEIGHWLDHHYGWLSDSEQFRKIYQKECDNFAEIYKTVQIDNEKELFAEGFLQYINYPEKLRKEAPMLYAYLEDFNRNI